MSKQENKKPVTLAHVTAMVCVGVIGALIAFWVLSSIVGIIFFFVKVIVVVALIVGAFWLVHRLRK